MENIKNKTVLITGAASGLGYKYAEQLLRHGAKTVAILDLSTSPGPNSVATLEKEFGKGKAYFFPCDVSNREEFEASFKKAVETLNGLDIVINNAGILDDKRWLETIDINIMGLTYGSFMTMDHMGKHKGGKGGTLVNIASIVGLEPCTAFPVYSASKHAVIGLSRSIQDFYHTTGVRVLVMCPGVTTTGLFGDYTKRTPDFITPEEVTGILSKYPCQATDTVADAMVDLIQKGKNGAIWVAEGSQPPYEVVIPHYSKLAVAK